MIVNDIYTVSDFNGLKKLNALSPSSKFILYILKQSGALNQKQILNKTLLPKRTVAYSLKRLLTDDFITKHIDTKDKRIRIYEARV